MVHRIIFEQIIKDFQSSNRAIIIYGARRIGKTTLLKEIEKYLQQPVLWINGDEMPNTSIFENVTIEKLRFLFKDYKYIFVDEAQKIKNIETAIKLTVDNLPDKRIIATGSSAFGLSTKLKETLTGRVWEYQMFPFSFQELADHYGSINEINNLENRLIYGSYPEVVLNPDQAERVLLNLMDSTMFKDIFAFEGVKKPEILTKLVTALAFQIGSEVKLRELAVLIGTDKNTVDRYLTVLERTFIIFHLGSFSRNLRGEIKNGRKYYFWDTGLRNAVINNFNHINLRDDIGQLWENFLVSERIKYLKNNNIRTNSYFWRTYTQQEIDYIEERQGKLLAFEFKWNPRRKGKLPKSFIETYNASFKRISTDNYFEFLTDHK